MMMEGALGCLSRQKNERRFVGGGGIIWNSGGHIYARKMDWLCFNEKEKKKR
jgi:hypothetical protein